MEMNNTQAGCNPKNLKVIKDENGAIFIIQTELISAIGKVEPGLSGSGKTTYLELNTIRPTIYNFYISPEEVLEQINTQNGE